MSHDKNGTTGLNHMNKRQLAEGLEFLDDLTEDERKRFEALPDEDKHRCIAQNLISQDRKSTRLNSSHRSQSRMPSSA